MAELDPVKRPDGRTYKPRKPPRAIEVDNPDARPDEPNSYIYVLGTHDIERAHQLAVSHWSGVERSKAELTWVRQTMRDGDRALDYDPIRGAPTVIFEVTE